MKTPRIFVSATTYDLASARRTVADGLLSVDCMPIVQENFPPDTRSVLEMLRSTIASCDAVIHIAGFHYGAEPAPKKGSPRRSYTHLEYDVARELKKPVYLFLPEANFPFDKAPQNSEFGDELQTAHRTALKNSGHLYVEIGDQADLGEKVREMKEEVKALRYTSERARKRTLGMVCVLILVLTFLSAAMLINLGQQESQKQELLESRKLQEEAKNSLDEQAVEISKVSNDVSAIKAESTPSTPERLRKLLDEFAFRHRIDLGKLEPPPSIPRFLQTADDSSDITMYLQRRRRVKTLAWNELRNGNAETALSVFLFFESLENSSDGASMSVLSGVAESFELLEQYDQSFSYYRSAIYRGDRIHGRNDFSVSSVINDYGVALYRGGEFRRALGAVQYAVSAMEGSYRNKEFRIITYLNNVIGCLIELDDVERAEIISARTIETLLALEKLHGKKFESRDITLSRVREAFEDAGKTEAEMKAIFHPKAIRLFSEIPKLTPFLAEQIGAAEEKIDLKPARKEQRYLGPDLPFRRQSETTIFSKPDC